ncbi:MAG: hypothetical protein LBD77_08930, partial [Bifidobacteriaceae bacterium]|nr:hypothetical protein [Bifidobacteriaceae bacterium]
QHHVTFPGSVVPSVDLFLTVSTTTTIANPNISPAAAPIAPRCQGLGPSGLEGGSAGPSISIDTALKPSAPGGSSALVARRARTSATWLAMSAARCGSGSVAVMFRTAVSCG